MKLAVLSEDLKLMFARAIIANELGGQLSLIYKFSDPDGVRTGKSGWSFGICQYDINNNPNALLALREMDFTTDEIAGLRAQTIDNMAPMDYKLFRSKDIVDKWDRRQLRECLEIPLLYCKELAVEFSSEETFLHIADYHNQFYMSRGGKLYVWLKEQKKEVTPEMVRDFKLALPWGKKRPDDVNRRYSNIVKIASI